MSKDLIEKKVVEKLSFEAANVSSDVLRIIERKEPLGSPLELMVDMRVMSNMLDRICSDIQGQANSEYDRLCEETGLSSFMFKGQKISKNGGKSFWTYSDRVSKLEKELDELKKKERDELVAKRYTGAIKSKFRVTVK